MYICTYINTRILTYKPTHMHTYIYMCIYKSVMYSLHDIDACTYEAYIWILRICNNKKHYVCRRSCHSVLFL